MMTQFAKQPTRVESDAVTVIAAIDRQHADDFAADVAAGLVATPRSLSCRYFYDAEGSELFEQICSLPEYYPTRTERAILAERAGEIAALFPDEITLVELGSGSAVKTRLIMDALIEHHGGLRFIPVDISRSALEESSVALVEDFEDLEILAVAGEYEDGLAYLKGNHDGRKLILWLGSNVGNFHRSDAIDFFRKVREAMTAEDRFLAGIDLRKDRQILEAAYDDSQGVTAKFNKNILVRLNRDVGGHFDLDAFRHMARYDEELGRVEMHLVSERAQTVAIDALDLSIDFAAGETIHTENSYKYSRQEIEELATRSGLVVEHQWFDADELFSVNIFAPASS